MFNRATVSVISIFLIFSINLSTVVAISLNNVDSTIYEVDEDINKIYDRVDQFGASIDPLKFACYLRPKLVDNLISLIKYCNSIKNNLEIIRRKIGDGCFKELLSKNSQGELLKKFIGYIPDQERTCGMIERYYINFFKRIGISNNQFYGSYSQIGNSESDNDNKIIEPFKTEYQKFFIGASSLSSRALFKESLLALNKTQSKIFKALNTIDEYSLGNSEEVQQCKKQYKEIKLKLQQAAEKQYWTYSRLDLMSEKLSYLLGNINYLNENYLGNSISEQQTFKTSKILKYIDCLDDLRYIVADISYITNLDVMDKELKTNIFPVLLLEYPHSKIVDVQKEVGKRQIRLYKLYELIMNSEDETLEEKEDWYKSDISKKLYAYSLNLYHTKGKNKAQYIWEKLGFTREDYGILEARILFALKNNQNMCKGRENDVADIGVTGLNFDQCKIKTVWKYENGIFRSISIYIQ